MLESIEARVLCVQSFESAVIDVSINVNRAEVRIALQLNK